jgi:hypothetical protein
MSVAVLEARVLALLAALQLERGVALPTAPFRARAVALRAIVHPLLAAAVGADLFLPAAAPAPF